MVSSNFDFDWKKSKAHRLLLSKFIEPKYPEDFTKTDAWESALKESPKKAIKRFVDTGLLKNGDLYAQMVYKYSVTDLKDKLKNRGLPVSGSKDELIKRLIQNDAAGMEKSIEGLTVLTCTEKGMELATDYVTTEKSKRKLAEQNAMEYIKKRRFEDASMTVVAFEAEQVFPRGMNIDWKNYDPSHDVEMLSYIYSNKPKILNKLGNDKLEALRLGAAMMMLWGKNKARQWLPPDLEIDMHLDIDAAARMFWFLSLYLSNIESYKRSSDVVEGVQIFRAYDACDACSSLQEKVYKLDEVPELPYEHCTHKRGCTCTLIPVVRGFPSVI